MSKPRQANKDICKSKKRFSNIAKARAAIRLTETIHKGRRPRPYFCPQCKNYHIASTE